MSSTLRYRDTIEKKICSTLQSQMVYMIKIGHKYEYYFFNPLVKQKFLGQYAMLWSRTSTGTLYRHTNSCSSSFVSCFFKRVTLELRRNNRAKQKARVAGWGGVGVVWFTIVTQQWCVWTDEPFLYILFEVKKSETYADVCWVHFSNPAGWIILWVFMLMQIITDKFLSLM